MNVWPFFIVWLGVLSLGVVGIGCGLYNVSYGGHARLGVPLLVLGIALTACSSVYLIDRLTDPRVAAPDAETGAKHTNTTEDDARRDKWG